MKLESLVADFNSHLQKERGSDDAPLEFTRGQVEARLGAVRLASLLKPVRLAKCPLIAQGYDAVLRAYVQAIPPREALDVFAETEGTSVVNLDRLCRTVHLLNFLPLSEDGAFLHLEVNPRHVLNVKDNHGAYFEDVLTRCGLETKQVVIGVAFDHLGTSYQLALAQGLQNYRKRGYRVAIRLTVPHPEKIRQSIGLVTRLLPDYLKLDSAFLSDSLGGPASSLQQTRIRQLVSLTHCGGGQVIQDGVDHTASVQVAGDAGVDLVMGELFERPTAAAERRAARNAALAQ